MSLYISLWIQLLSDVQPIVVFDIIGLWLGMVKDGNGCLLMVLDGYKCLKMDKDDYG